MIGIQPGYRADAVLGHLEAAHLGARNLLGNEDHASLHKYVNWATTHLRTLGPAIKPDDVDALITTKHYWTLISLLSGGGTGVPGTAVKDLLYLEISQRAAALEVAHDELQNQMMMSKGIDAAVLDTNVVMVLRDQLDTYDWHAALKILPLEPLVIWIPLAVIDELDRKKSDRNKMVIEGKGYARRTMARVALRNIDRMFPDPRGAYVVSEPKPEIGPLAPKTELRILMEEPGHIRLSSVDAEIVDQAVSLMGLGGRVKVVTFDTGMRLKARSAELAALQLPDPEDEEKD